jgi:DNA polymerase III epsilon subunit-like protein
MKEISCDTETGGLDPLRHALLQIGAFDPTTGSRFNVHIRKPGALEVTMGAAKVNGWPHSHEEKDLKEESTAIKMFMDWVDLVKPERIWYHNAPFDVGFLKNAMSRNMIDGSKFPRAFCTMSQAESLNRVGGLPVNALSLNSLIKELLPDRNRLDQHDAAEDAQLTWEVHMVMNERFDNLAKLANLAATGAIGGPTTQTRQPRHKAFGR